MQNTKPITLRQFIKILKVKNELEEFAARCGISSRYLNDMQMRIATGTGVDPKTCALIEQHSDKAITRQELRPKDWQIIWPELKKKAK